MEVGAVLAGSTQGLQQMVSGPCRVERGAEGSRAGTAELEEHAHTELGDQLGSGRRDPASADEVAQVADCGDQPDLRRGSLRPLDDPLEWCALCGSPGGFEHDEAFTSGGAAGVDDPDVIASRQGGRHRRRAERAGEALGHRQDHGAVAGSGGFDRPEEGTWWRAARLQLLVETGHQPRDVDLVLGDRLAVDLELHRDRCDVVALRQFRRERGSTVADDRDAHGPPSTHRASPRSHPRGSTRPG